MARHLLTGTNLQTVELEMEDSLVDSKIRLYQNNLFNSGWAVIVFGLWSCIRPLLAFYTERKELLTAIETICASSNIPLTRDGLFWILVTVVILVSLPGLAVRFYLGYSAIQEAQGRKKGRMWLAIAILYILLSLSLDFWTLTSLTDETTLSGTLNVMSSLIIDLTSTMAIVITLVSAIQLRQMGAPKDARERG